METKRSLVEMTDYQREIRESLYWTLKGFQREVLWYEFNYREVVESLVESLERDLIVNQDYGLKRLFGND